MAPKDETLEAVSRTIWVPNRDEVTVHGLLGALSDPMRLEIVRQLAERGEQRPADFLDMGSKQNLTHHLRVLRDAGVLGARYQGRNKVLWLRRDLMDEVLPGLLDGVLRTVSTPEEKRASFSTRGPSA